jgi:hypothetical protein
VLWCDVVIIAVIMLLLRIYFYVVYTGNRFLFPIATENGAQIVNEPDPAYSLHTSWV